VPDLPDIVTRLRHGCHYGYPNTLWDDLQSISWFIKLLSGSNPIWLNRHSFFGQKSMSL
jgi:hypothetical protein